MYEAEYSHSCVKLVLGFDIDIHNFLKEVSIDS